MKIKNIWIYLISIFVLPLFSTILLGILQDCLGESIISDGLAVSVINVISYVIPFIWYIKLYIQYILEDKEKCNWKTVFLSLGCFYLCILLFGLVESLLHTKEISNNQATLNVVFGYSFFIGSIVTGFLGPFVEEIAFRFIFQDWLNGKMKNKTLSILFSALFFTVIHLSELDLWVVCNYFVSALFLTVLYQKRHNIFLNIVVHSLFNIIQILLSIALVMMKV